jgi:hypothetical protein
VSSIAAGQPRNGQLAEACDTVYGSDAHQPTRLGWTGRQATIPVAIRPWLRHHYAMAEPFRLQGSDGCEWRIDLPNDPYGDGYVRRAGVEIRAEGLAARTAATIDIVQGQADLDSFFAGLASSWQGWEGVRHWEALEHEMAIDAWHDGRANVKVAVTVRRSTMTYADDAWSARVVFTVEAGEQLASVARNITDLFAT